MFSGSPARLAAGGVFTLLLLFACVVDVRERRLPNALVAVLGVAGLAFSGLAWPAPAGLWRGLEGLAVGLAIWLPCYLLGMIGAGDVKLFAAAGAWLGPWSAVVASMLAALAGGVLALGWMVAEQGVAGTSRSLWLWLASVGAARSLRPAAAAHSTHRVPYGIALATGAVIVGWLPGVVP
jgi:prepilin peptidase CpaA